MSLHFAPVLCLCFADPSVEHRLAQRIVLRVCSLPCVKQLERRTLIDTPTPTASHPHQPPLTMTTTKRITSTILTLLPLLPAHSPHSCPSSSNAATPRSVQGSARCRAAARSCRRAARWRCSTRSSGMSIAARGDSVTLQCHSDCFDEIACGCNSDDSDRLTQLSSFCCRPCLRLHRVCAGGSSTFHPWRPEVRRCLCLQSRIASPTLFSTAILFHCFAK